LSLRCNRCVDRNFFHIAQEKTILDCIQIRCIYLLFYHICHIFQSCSFVLEVFLLDVSYDGHIRSKQKMAKSGTDKDFDVGGLVAAGWCRLVNFISFMTDCWSLFIHFCDLIIFEVRPFWNFIQLINICF
jgi:hypothetical protein